MAVLLVSVRGPAGDHDLAVDGELAVATLLGPLAAAVGVVDDGRWRLADGDRVFGGEEVGLTSLGVLSGSRLRLVRVDPG